MFLNDASGAVCPDGCFTEQRITNFVPSTGNESPAGSNTIFGRTKNKIENEIISLSISNNTKKNTLQSR